MWSWFKREHNDEPTEKTPLLKAKNKDYSKLFFVILNHVLLGNFDPRDPENDSFSPKEKLFFIIKASSVSKKTRNYVDNRNGLIAKVWEKQILPHYMPNLSADSIAESENLRISFGNSYKKFLESVYEGRFVRKRKRIISRYNNNQPCYKKGCKTVLTWGAICCFDLGALALAGFGCSFLGAPHWWVCLIIEGADTACCFAAHASLDCCEEKYNIAIFNRLSPANGDSERRRQTIQKIERAVYSDYYYHSGHPFFYDEGRKAVVVVKNEGGLFNLDNSHVDDEIPQLNFMTEIDV